MKFLIDAQLPRRFVGWLTEAGHDALHTLDLPMKNRSPDSEVIACAFDRSHAPRGNAALDAPRPE